MYCYVFSSVVLKLSGKDLYIRFYQLAIACNILTVRITISVACLCNYIKHLEFKNTRLGSFGIKYKNESNHRPNKDK